MTREQEDQFDGELATKRLAEGGKRYSSEEAKAELGLLPTVKLIGLVGKKQSGNARLFYVRAFY